MALIDNSPRAAPMVSVVMPVYNGERYLAESLDSVLAQNYPNFEVLVMDDASTDGTCAIVEGYGSRVRGYRQPTNRGIYANTNDGINMAKGEYIAFYHADDVYEPTIIEREVAVLEASPEVGAVFCKDLFIDAASRVYGRLELPSDIQGSRALGYSDVLNALLTHKNAFLRCPSCLARASVYRDVGLYRQEEFRNTADLDMWLRVSSAYPIVVLDEYLFRYRHNVGNSGQRYRHLRTDPERFFTIMDLQLSSATNRGVARRDALAAYEGHRAQDNLMRAISYYVLGQIGDAARVLREVDGRSFLTSPRSQRGRMLVLLGTLQVLVRLPRIPQVADALYRRWHAQTAPAATARLAQG
jgi:glycosyltransferase involved in cell wall biosynthesis